MPSLLPIANKDVVLSKLGRCGYLNFLQKIGKERKRSRLQLSALTVFDFIKDMGRLSAGKQWEDLNRRRQIAENEELEAQRAAAYQEVRAQVAGLPCLTSANANLLIDGTRRMQDTSKSRFHRVEEDMLELEAPETSPPPYTPRGIRAPPDVDSAGLEVDSGEKFVLLQKEVEQKECEVQRLESEVEVEMDRRRHLQAERHGAVDAQRRAEDEAYKLKSRVADLDSLLDGSIKRQKELELELDLSRQEVRDLKRQLHEEGCSYESDIRAREKRERQTKQQLKDTTSMLESYIERNGRPEGSAESLPERKARGETRSWCGFAGRQ